jgi:hypothetical protein
VSLYRDIRTAVRATWTANWPHGSTYQVLWHQNELLTVPTDTLWLHNTLEFGVDQVRAFGAGRLANERLLAGSVAIRVFCPQGYGEDAALDLLSDAVATLRGRRDGPLSFTGAISNLDGDAAENGAWWVRTAIVAFEYRHVA